MANSSGRVMISTPYIEVDVTEFAPITEHPIFNALQEKSQLSFVEKVFSGGSNKRREHAAFVKHFTEALCGHLKNNGYLEASGARHVIGGSLVHDLGHPPFSHAIDNLLSGLYTRHRGAPKDHHTRTEELIREHLSDIYRSLGLDPEEIIRIVTKRSEKSKIISHNTLGTDKCGYLLLDSHHTVGYMLSLPLFINLFPYYYYSEDSFGIQESKIEEVEAIQAAIQNMYMKVYLHEDVLRHSRYVQKAVESAVESGELDLDKIWDMPEGALVYRLNQSKNPGIRQHMSRYDTNKSQRPSAVLKIRGDDRHVVLPEPSMSAICERIRTPLDMTKFEKDFAGEFHLPDKSTYMTLSADPQRVIPQDLDLYDGNTKRGSLFERYPKYRNNLLEKAEDFFTVRIYSDRPDFPPKENVRGFVLSYFRDG